MNFIPSYIRDQENRFTNEEVIFTDVFDDQRVIVELWIRTKPEPEGTNTDFVMDRAKLKAYTREMITVVESLTRVRKSRITIVYYPTMNKKVLPNDHNKTITIEHMNSGLHFINSTETEVNIMIHRREEFYKVLLHEMLHLYEVEANHEQNDQITKELFLSTDLHIRTNESVTELYATILNCMIIAKLQNLSVADLIMREYEFSLFQMHKLFAYFDIIEYTIEEINSKWKESTHAFSYMVFKTFLFHVFLMAVDFGLEDSSIRKTQDDSSIRKMMEDEQQSLRMTSVDYDDLFE
jgi:hypothetical protein